MSRIVELSASRLIPVPVEVVWEITDHPVRNTEWANNVRAVTRSGGRARVGDTFEEVSVVVGRWTSTTVWRIETIVHHRERTYRGSGFPGVGELRPFLRFEPFTDDDGGRHTRVTYGSRLELRLGPLDGLGAGLLGRLATSEFETSLAALERLALREQRLIGVG